MRRILKPYLSLLATMLTISACLPSAPSPSVTATGTRQTSDTPTSEMPTSEALILPTVSPEDDSLHLPEGFLADPDTACAIDLFSGLSCLDQDGWHVYEATSFISPLWIPVTMIECNGDRTYWSDGTAVYQLVGRKAVRLGDKDIPAEILVCAPGEGLWGASLQNLYFFDGFTWISCPSNDALCSFNANDDISSLDIALDGDLAVTYGKNLAIFNGTAWRIISPPESGYLYSVQFDERENIWVPNNGNLMMYDGVAWTTFPGPEPSHGNINRISIDREQRIWAIGQSGLYLFNPLTNTWEDHSPDQYSYPDSILDMQVDNQGRLWITTDYGLKIFDGAKWTGYRMDTADLYSNTASYIVVLRNGPELPPVVEKAGGSVGGRLVNADQAEYSGAHVMLCLSVDTFYAYSGETPCLGQAYFKMGDVNPDGIFLITDVRPGNYYLMIQSTGSWGYLARSNETIFTANKGLEFKVLPGIETNLGNIDSPAH